MIRIFIFTLAAFFLLSCGPHSRFSAEEALAETKSIRDAQIEIKKQTGRFATLDELYEKRLISFQPGRNSPFLFECQAGEDQYKLSVREKDPLPVPQSESLSLYSDESGVIRANYRADEPANRESYPIKE